MEGKTSLFENVNIDWLLISDDYVDFSDDDLESVSFTHLNSFTLKSLHTDLFNIQHPFLQFGKSGFIPKDILT